MIDYTQCPACSGKRIKTIPRAGIVPEHRTCRRCNAIFGEMYLGDSYTLVLPRFTTRDVPAEEQRYFDFLTLGSKGLSRRHGWYDPKTRGLVQIG
jgi:hypothetical protein